MVNNMKKIFSLISVILVLTSSTTPVYAFRIRQSDLHDIIVGRPHLDDTAEESESGCTNNDSSGSGGGDASSAARSQADAPTSSETGKAYNGAEIFSQAQKDQINANKGVYEEAATAAGIPWQMVAVIHNNEHGLAVDNPSNGQGIYQDYERLGNGGRDYPPGPVSQEEFKRQSIWAARFLKGKTSLPLTGDGSEKGVKDSFFGYNGRASAYKAQAFNLGFNAETEGYEGSPYVMNKADEKRDPAVQGTNGTWGQIKRDGEGIEYPANDFYGAFVQYGALAGLAGCSTSTELGAKIAEIAEREFAANGGKDLEASNGEFKYTDGNKEQWCADFVSWVLKEAESPFDSGVSGGWRIPAVTSVKAWFEAHGSYHAAGSGYTPKVGDIVIYKNGMSHVNIVVAVNGTTMTTIGGNETNGIRKTDKSITSSSITGFGTKSN